MAHRIVSDTHRRGAAACLLAACLALAVALVGPAGAEEDAQGEDAVAASEWTSTGSSPVTDAVPDELQRRVEETAAAYNDAVARREELEQQAADCQARIAEIEARLPDARERAAQSMYSAYRFQQNGGGLLALLLSADDFNSFISMLQYLTSIERHNANQIQELVSLTEELFQQQATLDESLAAAREEESAAQEALAQAQEARVEAQRQAQEAARQAAAARAAAKAQVSELGTAATADSATSGASEGAGDASAADASSADAAEGGGAQVPDEPGDAASDGGDGGDSAGETGGDETVVPDDGANWTDERSTFIAEWGARIDAYLSGSALSGYGGTFAAAAWDYGVDPRWSPAIAYAESSLGAYCFRPYNAWGWGSSSWGSWEEAVYAHVAGLARGYGYTLDYDAAQRYCPTNVDYWYSTVAAQMSQI